MKTWIFLDRDVARVQFEDPQFAPFGNAYEGSTQELDEKSGVRIVWAQSDGDLHEDYRVKLLMGWLEDFEERITPYFDKFTKAAKQKETGGSQSMVGPQSVNDGMFEGEAVTNQSIFEFDKQQTPMLPDGYNDLDFADNRLSLADRAATQRAQSQYINKKRQNSISTSNQNLDTQGSGIPQTRASVQLTLEA